MFASAASIHSIHTDSKHGSFRRILCLSSFLFRTHQIVRSKFYLQWYVLLHVTCVSLSTVESHFVCVYVRINLFRNLAFTRISLFTVIGYYLFTRVRSLVLNFRLIFIFTLCVLPRERVRCGTDGGQIKSSLVHFTRLSALVMFTSEIKSKQYQAPTTPCHKWDEWWRVFSIKNWIHNKCMFIWLPLSFTILLSANAFILFNIIYFDLLIILQKLINVINVVVCLMLYKWIRSHFGYQNGIENIFYRRRIVKYQRQQQEQKKISCSKQWISKRNLWIDSYSTFCKWTWAGLTKVGFFRIQNVLFVCVCLCFAYCFFPSFFGIRFVLGILFSNYSIMCPFS